MQCPDCEKPLATTQGPEGTYFLCSHCQGRMFAVAVMKRLLGAGAFQTLWNQSEAAASSGICPECGNAAPQVKCDISERHAQSFEVRLCKTCQTTWIEGRFADALPASFHQKKHDPLASLSKEDRIAHAEALAGTTAIAHKRVDAQAPEELWKWPLGAAGFAVRFTPAYVASTPYACYALSAIAVAVTWFLSGSLQEYGFVPTEPLAKSGLTLATSIFLHGGFLHLLSNLYYLMTFGPELESRIGTVKFAALFVATAWVGIALHGVMDPRSETPLIGASGGIAGVLALYALTFPKARVGIFLWLWPIVFRWLALPAFFALGLWIMQQLLGSLRQVSGFDHVSYLAHLGGIAAAAAIFLVKRFYPGAREKSSIS